MSTGQEDRRLIGELLRNPNAARVRYAERAFAAAGHPDIRATHIPVLEYIDHDHGSRITYLARHANVTVQSMAEVVANLEKWGYVERVPDPTDGRAKLVRLTGRGHELYSLAVETITGLEDDWARRLGGAKMRELKRLLAELWDVIED